MKILVLYGGDSPERDVSLRSGRAVYDACVAAGFKTSLCDPADGLESLRAAVVQVDVVLPILHGLNGEDGVLQKQLEDLGAKYLGAGSEVSALCFDKVKTHNALEQVGMRMPRHAVVSSEDIDNQELFTTPYVLKPIMDGSSMGLQIVRQVTDQSYTESTRLLGKYKKMLLEELIEGQEITVPILGDRALPVIAINPPANGEFDYENKYNGATEEIVPVPEDVVSTELQQQAQELALLVHQTLGVRHLSRTDMIVTNDGEIVVLEINTIPGMTDQSLMPKSAAAAGMSMTKLVQELVTLAAN